MYRVYNEQRQIPLQAWWWLCIFCSFRSTIWKACLSNIVTCFWNVVVSKVSQVWNLKTLRVSTFPSTECVNKKVYNIILAKKCCIMVRIYWSHPVQGIIFIIILSYQTNYLQTNLCFTWLLMREMMRELLIWFFTNIENAS